MIQLGNNCNSDVLLFTDNELNRLASDIDKVGNFRKIKDLSDGFAQGDVEYLKLMGVIESIRSKHPPSSFPISITVVVIEKSFSCKPGVSLLFFVGTPGEVAKLIDNPANRVFTAVCKNIPHAQALNVVVRFLDEIDEAIAIGKKECTTWIEANTVSIHHNAPSNLRWWNKLKEVYFHKIENLTDVGDLLDGYEDVTKCSLPGNNKKSFKKRLANILSRSSEFTESVVEEAFIARNIRRVKGE